MAAARNPWHARIDKRRFVANLNVFVPLFVYGCIYLVEQVTVAITQASQTAGTANAFDYSAEPYVVAGWAGLLVLVWATLGLSPRGVAPGRERRHRLGQALLGVLNLAVFCTALLPLLLANLTGIEAIGHLMWFGIPALIIAGCLWPLGLLMVWTARGPAAQPVESESDAGPAPSPAPLRPPVTPAPSAGMKPPPKLDPSWRVGHKGRDQMFYEEWIDGRWERIEISGEMLMGRAHHVIYFASARDWRRYPEWARHRRSEIIQRIKSVFCEPDYEYQGG
ncbi:MAG: hypothetical protein ACT4QA_13470 [Panacagrimonas sp.]